MSRRYEKKGEVAQSTAGRLAGFGQSWPAGLWLCAGGLLGGPASALGWLGSGWAGW
jgi:hypothetical protein